MKYLDLLQKNYTHIMYWIINSIKTGMFMRDLDMPVYCIPLCIWALGKYNLPPSNTKEFSNDA